MKINFRYLLFLFPLLLCAQEITLEKQRLLILPTSEGEDYESIASRVTGVVASEATQLGRFEIIDRNMLEAIMNEQALQLSGIINDSDVVEIGKIAAAKEALLVNLYHFNQKGVPPEEDDDEDDDDDSPGLLGYIAKSIVDAAIDKAMEDVERYPNNIQTVIQGDVRKINLENGQSISSFSINVSYTGGNKGESLQKALNQVALRTSMELKEMYLLTSQVLDVRGREVILMLGRNLGLKKGTLFSINSPSTKRQVGGYEVEIPGRRVGFVKVTELSNDANRGTVLRNWEPIEPGFTAVESTSRIQAGGMSLRYGSESPVMGLDFIGYLNPMGRFDCALSIGLGTVQDSRSETDFTLRLGLDFALRMINTIPFSFSPVVIIPANFVFKRDDAEDANSVNAVLFNPAVGGRVEIMLKPNMDLVATVAWSPSSQLSKWRYSEEEDDETEYYDAEWDGTAPKIAASGLYFNIGVRFLMFDSPLKTPTLAEMSRFW